jgi:hypothetical protein
MGSTGTDKPLEDTMTNRTKRAIAFNIIAPSLCFAALYVIGGVAAAHPLSIVEALLCPLLFAGAMYVTDFVLLLICIPIRSIATATILVSLAPMVALGMVSAITPIVFPGLLVGSVFSLVYRALESKSIEYARGVV